MGDRPIHSEAEDHSLGSLDADLSEASSGSSWWIIHDPWRPMRERIASDHAARRMLALIVVVTMCMTTIILEVALVLRGADAAEVVAGLTPSTALASAVVTFYFTREK